VQLVFFTRVFLARPIALSRPWSVLMIACMMYMAASLHDMTPLPEAQKGLVAGDAVA
jgi:hypothetical protein